MRKYCDVENYDYTRPSWLELGTKIFRDWTITMALQCTMTFYGENEDDSGMPSPWFHYLVVASPGPKTGFGTASICPLTEARATGIAVQSSKIIFAKVGGAEAAMKEAELYLENQHKGLKKAVSTNRITE